MRTKQSQLASHLLHTYHQHLQSLACPSPCVGLGGKGERLDQLEEKSGWYGKLGIKGTSRSAPGWRAARARLGPRARARSPGGLGWELQHTAPEWVRGGNQARGWVTQSSPAPRANPEAGPAQCKSQREAADRGESKDRTREAKTEQSWRDAEEIKCQTRRQGVRSVVCFPRAEFKFYHLNNTPTMFVAVHAKSIHRFMHYKATRGF